MLHETLKRATQDNHDELENLMYVQEIMSGSLPVGHYKQILITNYVVHKLYEAPLYSALPQLLAGEINLYFRYKLAALEADMQELQLPLPNIDSLVYPAINYDADAKILGALYVLEGATLGGSVIVKKLKTNPNLNALNLNFNYYQVYGDQLIANWKTFVAVLNKQPESAYADIIAGATGMFNYIASVQKFHMLNMI